MKRPLAVIAAICLGAFASITHANTSYLLIQGPFGAGDTTETFKWQVNYPAGAITNGQQLLTAVFGQPVLTGSYTDAYSGTYAEYREGSGSQSLEYIYFGSVGGNFPISFTLGGTKVEMDSGYNSDWNYYAAGGSGGSGTYPNTGSWTYSTDGILNRNVSNGSYDGWVFGSSYPSATVDDSSGLAAPSSAEFSGTNATTFYSIVNVPEPGTTALIGFAALGALAFWRKK